MHTLTRGVVTKVYAYSATVFSDIREISGLAAAEQMLLIIPVFRVSTPARTRCRMKLESLSLEDLLWLVALLLGMLLTGVIV